MAGWKFMSDVEQVENRSPRDIDVVTFYLSHPPLDTTKILTDFPEFVSSDMSKTKYKTDHYIVDVTYSPFVIVENTRYWLQLFTHCRNNGVWRGMLRLELNTDVDDQQALTILNDLENELVSRN